MHKIAVLSGDGIGVEVMEAALPVIDALHLPWELHYGDIGWEMWKQYGSPIPEKTWSLLSSCDGCLLGAITSKPEKQAQQELSSDLQGKGFVYTSPIIQLRQKFDLFANVCPTKNLSRDEREIVIIRENTEGLYAGFDFAGVDENLWKIIKSHPNVAISGPENTCVSLRIQTLFGVERLIRFGCEYAVAHGFSKLTVADKPNVLRASGAFMIAILEKVASEYPTLSTEVVNADAAAMHLVTKPDMFEVLVCENMFGDILSDLGAGITGGLGMAPRGNFRGDLAYCEPVHGSVSRMVGKIGQILSP